MDVGMREVLTAAQMRAVEAAAMRLGTVTGLELMERAGEGVLAAVQAAWPALDGAGRRALVLCGPGNNGGDGFVIARLMADRGWRVDVVLMPPADQMPPDAQANRVLWESRGAVLGVKDLAAGWGGAAPDLIVDALFGTGITRPLSEAAQAALAGLDRLRDGGRCKVVAVDLPSGLCADSGHDFGARLLADLTVSFHRAKPGHYLGHGPALCGQLVVADIGLTQSPPPDFGAVMQLSHPDPAGLTKARRHKYDYGHALILGGGAGQGGAARLAARGALRIGAGLVTLGAPPEAMAENAARLDAVMLTPLDGPGALIRVLADSRITAVCAGPGWGVARAASFLPALLEASQNRALVLDADALTALGACPALIQRLPEACVLTPHWGEFARLFPDLAARAGGADPIAPLWQIVSEAAARAGCTVLLKGAATLVAGPSGDLGLNSALYDRAAPWLATAGSGDVLAGLICGLLARGIPPQEAALMGAWLHVEAARAFGPGLIAEDLPETLPQVLRALKV
jgi:ADP-dependent NAD(P)H-hydrate dehydratase / NAD(P)H-hydrate epimerase